jgi:hypothetical protein
MKMLEQTSVDPVFIEYKHEGMDAEAIASQIKQRFPNLPIILLSGCTVLESGSYEGSHTRFAFYQPDKWILRWWREWNCFRNIYAARGLILLLLLFLAALVAACLPKERRKQVLSCGHDPCTEGTAG